MLHHSAVATLYSLIPFMLGVTLSGCGSGDSNGVVPATHSISGEVTGLTGSVILLNNGGNALAVSSNGGFTFISTQAAGPYAVTIQTQPLGQLCSVTNGSGSITGENVTNVRVNCTTKSNVAYNIGNSLTWDSQPDGVSALASSQNINLTVGYHIKAGRPLSYSTANPSDATITNGYGTFTNALGNNAWTIVSIQPYIGSTLATSTLGTDIAAVNLLINLTKAGPPSNVRYYIYEGWPNTPSWSFPALSTDAYSTIWDAPSVNDLNTPTALSREYFDNLYVAVKAAHPNDQIFVIPVGSVLSALDKEISTGHINGLHSIYDLYRDSTHLTLDIGRFVAAATVYATYFGSSPVGLEVPPGFYTRNGQSNGQPSRLVNDIALRNQLEQVVWDVVSNDPRTGIGTPPE